MLPCSSVDGISVCLTVIFAHIPYILESNPHPFYGFRGLKNQMRIRIAVESWILEKMIEQDEPYGPSFTGFKNYFE
jgi:hypothetical protein